MSTGNGNILPPHHGPIIIKDETLWSDGKSIAKINLDLSKQLFATLSDYDMLFAGLEGGVQILPQLATKGTREYEKLRNNYAHEIENLIQLIRSSDHYKAAYALAHPVIEESETQTPTKKQEAPKQTEVVVAEKDENITDPLVQVILDTKDIQLSKEQRDLLDKYYANIVKQFCDKLSGKSFMIGGKSKKISIHDPLHNAVSNLFATAKKKRVFEPMGIVIPAKSGFRTKVKNTIQDFSKRLFGAPDNTDKEDIVAESAPFYKDIAIFCIEHDGAKIFVLLKFVSNRRQLMTEIEGNIVLEKNPTSYDKTVPMITIDHPHYIQTKMK